MHDSLQFVVRENPASDRRHGSCPRVDGSARENFASAGSHGVPEPSDRHVPTGSRSSEPTAARPAPRAESASCIRESRIPASGPDETLKPSPIAAPEDSPFLACILILPRDAEPIVSLLKRLADSCPQARGLSCEAGSEASRAADRWVRHSVAADYLGISKSTLYRYVSQQRIECRKMAGRLEYRESSLDKAKQAQIRPARFGLAPHDIILPTLNSGK